MTGPPDTIRRETDRDNPWPGLAPFEEGDREYFCGRDAAVGDVVRVVMREDLSLLYGRSGIGKTSLLRAGVFPELRDAQVFPVYIRLGAWREATAAREATPHELWKYVTAEVHRTAARWDYDVPAPASTVSAWEYFRRRTDRFWGRADTLATPLLVFDQFEEVFNRDAAGAIPPEVLESFLLELSETVSGTMPRALLDRQADPGDYLLGAGVFKVLFSFREEFLAQVTALEDIFPSIGRNTYRLGPLSVADAVGSVLEAGGHLIKGQDEERRSIADEIVAIVLGPRPEAARATDVVDPALLSLFCRELNEKRKGKEPAVIDRALVRSAEAARILTDFYESCMRQVSDGARRFVEDKLVLQQSRSRESGAVETALQAGMSRKEIDFLVEKRILRWEESARQGLPRIELTHDVLVEPALAAKRRRDVDDLRRQQQRWWLVAGGVAAAVLLIAFGLRSFSTTRAREASARDDQRRLQRVLVARQWQDSDPTRSALVLREANANFESLAGRATLLRTLSMPLAYLELKHDSALSWVDISPDGTRVVTGAQDGSTRIWSVAGDPPVLVAGSSPIVRAFFDPKGEHVVTSATDGQVRLVSLDGQLTQSLPHPAGTVVTQLAFSPNGTLLATGALNGTVRLWRRGSPLPQMLRPDPGDNGIVGLTFDRAGASLLAATEDGQVSLWSVGEVRAELSGQCTVVADQKGQSTATAEPRPQIVGAWFSEEHSATRFVQTVLESEDRRKQAIPAPVQPRPGIHIASSGKLEWFAIERLRRREACRIRPEPVDGFAGVTSRFRFLAGAADRAAAIEFLHQALTGVQRLQVRFAETGPGEGLVFDLPGAPHVDATTGSFVVPYVAAGFEDGSARVWHLKRLLDPLVLAGHTTPLEQIAVNGDRGIVVSRTGSTARVWRLDATGLPYGTPVVRLPHSRSVTSVEVSPDETLVLTTTQHNEANLWSIDGELRRQLVHLPPKAVRLGAFSPSGRTLLTIDSDSKLRLWHLPSGADDNVRYTLAPWTVTAASFSPDGSQVLAISPDAVRLFNATAPDRATVEKTAVSVPGAGGTVVFAAFNQKGSRMLLGTTDGTVHVRLAAQPFTEEPPIPSDAGCRPTGGSFSPDETMVLAACGTGDRARLWTKAPGSYRDLRHPQIASAQFSPDGRLVATAGRDGNVRLWQVDDPDVEPRVFPHGDQGITVAFSRDGRMLVSTGDDGKALLWQVDGVEAPLLLASQRKQLVRAVFTPSGDRVVIGSMDGTALVVTIDPKRLLDSIRHRTRICLPKEFRINELAEDEAIASQNARECEARPPGQ